MKKILFIGLLAAVLGSSTLAHAALHDRGRGLIYDDVLNITWLQDANYAKTSGYNDGVFNGMTPAEAVDNAKTWAANLIYAGYSGWRLPKASPVNGSSYNYSRLNNGSTDNSTNISAPDSTYPYSTASEMAYMFYVNLGNKGGVDVHGNPQSDCGFRNSGFFINIQNIPGDSYWLDIVNSPNSNYAGFFDSYYGYQSLNNTRHSSGYAWAVHDGDIGAPVPIPGAIILFAPGLVGLFALKKRCSKTAGL
jgi:hypothetical protein